MDTKMIESLVREVLNKMGNTTAAADSSRMTIADYPLQEKRPEVIKAYSGKAFQDITFEAALKGEVTFEDLRIHPDTLEYQAQIAESSGRPQLAKNLRRAAELTAVPDDEILFLYNQLRPHRATKEDLLGYADRLEKNYNATSCAQLFREAAEVYEKRGMLA